MFNKVPVEGSASDSLGAKMLLFKVVVLVFFPVLFIYIFESSFVEAFLFFIVLALGGRYLVVTFGGAGFLVLLVYPYIPFQLLRLDPDSTDIYVYGLLILTLLFRRFGRVTELDQGPEAKQLQVASLHRISRLLLLVLCILQLGLSMFRTYNWVACLSWVLIFYTLRRGVYVEHASKPALSIRSCIASASLCLLSVIGSLILLEGGARWLLPHTSVVGELYESHPDYLFLLRPGTTGLHRVRTAKDEVTIIEQKVSELGMRNAVLGPKKPDEFRILMLGDSFTMGHAVTETDTIPRQLELALGRYDLDKKVVVINAGVGGGGPIQELGMLLERGIQLLPDLVILQLYPENDIDNSLELVNKRQRAYNEHFHQRLELRRGETQWPSNFENWMQKNSRFYAELVTVTGDSPLITDLISTLRVGSLKDRTRIPQSEDRPFFLEINLGTWYPELNEGFEILQDYVRMMREECESRDIDFMAYCIPNHNIVDDQLWLDQMGRQDDPLQYTRAKGFQEVEQFLENDKIPSVNVMDLLQKHGDIYEVYYQYDGHLTPLGNELVASALRDYLCNTYFIFRGIVAGDEKSTGAVAASR
jgi:hypothetical protein